MTVIDILTRQAPPAEQVGYTNPLIWWATEPAPVRAVLDLAYARTELTPPVHDGILALVAPGHASVVREIADWLTRAEDIADGTCTDVSEDYVDREVAELRSNALRNAELVASLIGAGR